MARQYRILGAMDGNRTMDDIEWLERLFALPDTRPLSDSDLKAANQRHDQALAQSPWFRLWQHYGICSRGEVQGGLSLDLP